MRPNEDALMCDEPFVQFCVALGHCSLRGVVASGGLFHVATFERWVILCFNLAFAYRWVVACGPQHRVCRTGKRQKATRILMVNMTATTNSRSNNTGMDTDGHASFQLRRVI
ncbi:unnamed protein product [Ectocarpus sp. 13 AM-2016]